MSTRISRHINYYVYKTRIRGTFQIQWNSIA